MVGSRRSFLIYVAAILRHEPILAQPLGFVHGFASAVEQPAVQRTVSVPNFRYAVFVLKFRVAFLTGHQIKRSISASVLSFSCVRHTTFSFYHECRDCAIDACTKKHSGFSERVCIDTQQKRSAGMRSLHPLDAERMGFGHRPTSILQRKIAFVRTNALLAAEALKKKEYQMGV